MGALLPFAVAWHVSYEIAIAACAIGAVTLALGCHVVRERRLTALAIFPELAWLPELAGKRRHLASTRSRQALAHGLRRAAEPNQPSYRFDCCPVLRGRVAVVLPEMLELARALEQAPAPDPASVALIRELLTNGCSPLYNPNLATDALRATLTHARAGWPGHRSDDLPGGDVLPQYPIGSALGRPYAPSATRRRRPLRD